jgi:hypothetical protein
MVNAGSFGFGCETALGILRVFLSFDYYILSLCFSQKTGQDATNLDPSLPRVWQWTSPHCRTTPFYKLIDINLQQLYLTPCDQIPGLWWVRHLFWQRLIRNISWNWNSPPKSNLIAVCRDGELSTPTPIRPALALHVVPIDIDRWCALLCLSGEDVFGKLMYYKGVFVYVLHKTH